MNCGKLALHKVKILLSQFGRKPSAFRRSLKASSYTWKTIAGSGNAAEVIIQYVEAQDITDSIKNDNFRISS